MRSLLKINLYVDKILYFLLNPFRSSSKTAVYSFLYFIVLIFTILPVYSFTNVDSLLSIANKENKAKNWNLIAKYYEENIDTTRLRIYSQKAYNLAVSENSVDEKGKALLIQSTYYEYMGDLKTAIDKSTIALELFRNIDRNDLIADALEYLGYYYYETGLYDESINSYHNTIKLLLKIDSPDKDRNLGRAYVSVSNAYLRKDILDSAVYYNQKAFDAAYTVKDTLAMIEASNQLGVMKARQFNFKEALKYYEESLRLIQLIDNKRDLPYAYLNIATLYVEWRNFEFAYNFAQKAEHAANECGDLLTTAKILSFVSSIYHLTEHYTDAIRVAKKSSSLTQDNPYSQYNNLEIIATSYCMLGITDSSDVYLSKMEAYMHSGYQIKPIRYYATKGQILFQQEKFIEAIPFFEKAIELKKEGIEKKPENLYKALSIAYQKGPHDYKRALHYYHLYSNIADSIRSKEYANAMADFHVRYNTAEKELEITQLNLQQEQTKTEKARIIIWLMVIVALFLGALLYNVILRQKKKTEKILLNQKLEEKEYEFDALASDMEMRQIKSYLNGLEAERTRLAGELHDNVSNALLGVEFKMRTPGVSQEEVSGMLHGIHEHVRNISHELMPPVFQHATLAEIIADYVYMQNGMSGPRFECQMEPEDGWEDLPQETALELHRIIQEACGNALKHSGASLISIILQKNGDRITLIVKDNGRGMDVDSKKTGLGLHIIRDRAAKMNGSSEIVSAPGKGTTIMVTV